MTTDKPAVVFDSVSFSYPESTKPVFESLSLSLPYGIVSFVGQNGTGKSTTLLLGSGRILPDSGSVRLLDTPTDELTDEEARNRLASFIYQNMEFETNESIGDLLEFVYENGFHDEKKPEFLDDLTQALELKDALGRKLQLLSKGEMQRAILAFSMLYGSAMIMMDEPIFALESYQRERALEFVSDFAHRNQVPVYYSLHEIDLSRKYADSALLFYKDGREPMLGPVDEVLTDEHVEDAYAYPAAMLHQREYLFRERLLEISQKQSQ